MKVSKKFIRLGTSPGEISGSDIPANHTTTNYTESSSDIAGHLSGIDSALGTIPLSPSGDINETSFTIANNQAVSANVTGLAFNNANVRSAEIQYSILIDADADLYEEGVIHAVQNGTGWDWSQQPNFDNSLVIFSVTTSGQFQYTSASYTGYVSGTMKFRARTTSV